MLRGRVPLSKLERNKAMVTEKTLMKFGLTNDSDKSKLKEMFKDNSKLREVHIDIYPDNPLDVSPMPFMLLLRTIEKKAVVENRDSRFIIKKNDRFNTYIMNVLLSEITECYYEISEGCFEFILKIQNVYYRITVLN